MHEALSYCAPRLTPPPRAPLPSCPDPFFPLLFLSSFSVFSLDWLSSHCSTVAVQESTATFYFFSNKRQAHARSLWKLPRVSTASFFSFLFLFLPRLHESSTAWCSTTLLIYIYICLSSVRALAWPSSVSVSVEVVYDYFFYIVYHCARVVL